MKIVNQYMLRKVRDDYLAIPVGADVSLNTMITLNETGAFLWKLLKTEHTEQQLVQALLDEYDVSEEAAKKDVEELLIQMRLHKII